MDLCAAVESTRLESDSSDRSEVNIKEILITLAPLRGLGEEANSQVESD